MNMPISIADYDPCWPRLYEEEKARILAALGADVICIEHIGSTSIPGLAAKPIIDVLAGVGAFSDTERYVSRLRDLGYEFVPEASSTRHFFRKFHEGVRTHHVHIVPAEGFWGRHELLFRDHLGASPALRAEYALMKRDLAVRLGHDRDAYTDAKTLFIQRVVDEARAARGCRIRMSETTFDWKMASGWVGGSWYNQAQVDTTDLALQFNAKANDGD